MPDKSQMRFIDLRHMREAGDTSDVTVAAEHRAFAREVIAEKPAMALAIAGSIIPYQLLKMSAFGMGRFAAGALTGGKDSNIAPSGASLLQTVEAYKGVLEGLKLAASSSSPM